MKEKQIDSFRIFKIISCLSVVLVHYGQIASLSGIPKILTDFGAYGVYMFFIISGFLGYLSYSKSLSCKQYYLKRIFRILPLYYTIIIYNIILYEFVLRGYFQVPVDSSHLKWLRYFLLLSQIIPSSDNFWVNLSASWTISHFLFFYLLVPLFFKYVNTLSKALLLQISCLIFNFLWSAEYLLPLTSLYYFVIGITVYLAFTEHKENSLIAFSCLLSIFFLLFHHDFKYIYSNIFMLLIIASKDFHVSNTMVSKCIALLEEYSFTVYLVHAIVIEAITFLIKMHPLSPLQILIILVFGTTIISILFHCLIEKNVNHFASSKIINKR